MTALTEAAAPRLYPLDHPLERRDAVTGLILPRDVDEALEYRPALLKALKGNKEAQEGQKAKCADSIIYWLNWYCFTFVVRKYGPDGRLLKRNEYEPHVPFVTWPVQDAALTRLVRCVADGEDAIIDKSRDMGASWLVVALSVWMWLYVPEAQIGLCSRVEDDVDTPGDPKSLLWKIDYLLGRLPPWMLPCEKKELQSGGKLRNHLILRHPESGAVIRGEATTDHLFRGDRLHFIAFDEMAAIENATAGWQAASDATGCKIGNSTPVGPGTEYTIQRNKGLATGSPVVIELGYWNHPDKGVGRTLVRDEEGSLTGIAGRVFWDTPFLREQLKRRDAQDIGQNILIDHITSGDLFFNATIVTQHLKLHGREPVRCEMVSVHGEWVFQHDPKGRWYVWCDLDPSGRPKQEAHYVAFADLSHGRGSSNSVCYFMDRDTGKVAASFVSPHVSTYEFADEVCRAGRWVFAGGRRQAYLGYEVNGPGEDWHRDLKRNGYSAIFVNRSFGKMSERKGTDYGWRSDRKGKRRLLTALGRAMVRGEIECPDRSCLAEMLEYVFFDDGSIGPGSLRDELTGAREAHGDRVIALAGLVFMRREVGHYRPELEQDKPGTYGHFLGMAETFEKIRKGQI